MLRKYAPQSNAVSPFYAWDAHMELDVTMYRRESGALTFRSLFQSVGTENFGSRVSVGGTGYVIGFGYLHTYSPDFTLSAGIAHFSSHLTRDLDEKIEDESAEGTSVPVVLDPDEYNSLYLRAYRRLSHHRFTPEFECTVQPISIDLGGGRRGQIRPVYLRTRWVLWRGREHAVAAETQHELGTNAFNHFSLLWQLGARDETDRRLQLFISGAPGSTMHVSPNIGGLRDGIAFGLRMNFSG